MVKNYCCCGFTATDQFTYCIALNFGGPKLWKIKIHWNFWELNIDKMNIMSVIIVHNLVDLHEDLCMCTGDKSIT